MPQLAGSLISRCAVAVLAAVLAACGGAGPAPAEGPPLAATGPLLEESSAPPPAGAILVEIVNDTDNAGGDAAMYLLFDTPKKADPATAVAGIPLLAQSGDKTANGQGVALSTLARAGTATSTFTGKTRNVYRFGVNQIDSGRLTFSYGRPMAIVAGAAPTAASPTRYDKMELTFLDGAGGGNLTAIDFHGIPLMVEVTHAGEKEPDPLQTKSFHVSMPTLLKMLTEMGKPRGVDMSDAFVDDTGTGKFAFQPGVTTDFSRFTRVLSPNTLSAMPARNGSPAPYPSFDSYLKSLVGKSYVVNGTQYGGYTYTATFGSDGAKGYKVVATGTVTTPQAIDPKLVVPPLPGPAAKATVTLNLPVGMMDFYTYATVVNQLSYSIAGYPFQGGVASVPNSTATVTYTAQDTVDAANASAYGALVGDIQAALNFGYLGGRFDASATGAGTQDISRYYAAVQLPYAYPYGGARRTNDGYYNPYAGLMYYLSDAYGHPFSDRVAAASPLYSLAPGDRVRITILNDNRLDTPLVSVSTAGTSTLALDWPTVPGASAYTVTTSPAGGEATCPQPPTGGTVSCSVSGLRPGTAYLVSVAAKGVSREGARAIRSGTLPVQGITTGAGPGPGSGPYRISFGVNLPDAPPIPGMSAYINGARAQADVLAVEGPNVVSLRILDADGGLAYASNYFLTVKPLDATTFTLTDLRLEYGMTRLTTARPGGTTPPFPNSGGLVIGTPFTPKPFYRYYPSVLP